jgi:hypothetical protein
MIEGVVVEKSNSPISDVLIRVYGYDSEGRMQWITGGRSSPDGSFDIKSRGGGPIMVRFDPPGNWHPALISSLSGNHSHCLNQVLAPTGDAYSIDEILELCAAYERLHFIDAALHPSDEDVHQKYRGNLGMVKWLDEYTGKRVRDLLHVYDR